MTQGNDSFRLVVRRGPQPNQVYDLNKDIITLGRDITNDITINDPEVSRHHMRLTRGAGGFTAEDLGSTNGTFVNGQRLTGARPLRNGDMIGLGETVTLGYEAAAAAGYGGQEPVSPATAPTGGPPPGMNMPPQQQPPGGGYMPPQPAQQPPPQQQQPQGQPYGGYSPPQQSPPPGEYSPPAPGSGFDAAPAPYAPQAMPGQGYDYDPLDMRDDEPRSNARWVLIGCVGISVFCCCGTLVAGFAIDQLCLWDSLPIIYDVIQALGFGATC